MELMLIDNVRPSKTPSEIPANPIIKPWIKNIDPIVLLLIPRDINIAISFCLFITSRVNDETILNDAIAIIRANIINITLFSLFIAWKSALCVSVQLLVINEFKLNNWLETKEAWSGSFNFNFMYENSLVLNRFRLLP